MDLLTDILHQTGLRRRVLKLRHLDSNSALQFPCNKSMGLHVVTYGEVYVHAPALTEPLHLQAGDIALMARGCHHTLSPKAELQGCTMQTLNYTDVSEFSATDANDKHSAVISGATRRGMAAACARRQRDARHPVATGVTRAAPRGRRAQRRAVPPCAIGPPSRS